MSIQIKDVNRIIGDQQEAIIIGGFIARKGMATLNNAVVLEDTLAGRRGRRCTVEIPLHAVQLINNGGSQEQRSTYLIYTELAYETRRGRDTRLGNLQG